MPLLLLTGFLFVCAMQRLRCLEIGFARSTGPHISWLLSIPTDESIRRAASGPSLSNFTLIHQEASHLCRNQSQLTVIKGTNSPSLPVPQWLSISYLPLNLGTLAGVLYSALYILMEPVAGGMLAPLLLAGTAYANHLTSE